ncbi:MAG TPA: kelch repeat-containing protein [Bradyrhizobium sp.]|nr:kelch repeat-containing protein [Bradyrhizobium sp.]
MIRKTGNGEISAKLGDYQSFRAEMLALIPRVVVDTGGAALTRPLMRLDPKIPTDPTVAMVDAFAAVADVISFYQDRVLNEGYLGTAIDYSSLALLARGVGESPGPYIGATAEIALFAQPGKPVTVPMGAAIQANPPRSNGGTAGPNSGKASTASDAVSTAAAPIFETAVDIVAYPALNKLTPLQTRPVHLNPDTESLLLQGTGLGLAVGGFMLFARRGDPAQWVRLTVFSVSENHTLLTTTVGIGSSLQAQWTASGGEGKLPRCADEIELHAFDLTCRLFGYNAPSWSSQSAAVRQANTPTGLSPAEFSEWPGFAINLNDLDLQAVYPRVLPGNQFLLETPEQNTLGTIAAVSRVNLSEFGLTGQATHVTLNPDPAVMPSGIALIPARTGMTASPLSDGRVLLVGGIGEEGALDSVEVYDPATGLVSQVAALPSKRGLHTATAIEHVVYLAGGVTEDAKGDWQFATDILRLDPATLTFTAISGVTLSPPRVGHAALALPDGTLMLSGGSTGDPARSYATLEALLEQTTATTSVVVFAPLQNGWAWEAQMQSARAGHSATLCPVVVKPTAGGGSASTPPMGQIVVFLGGHDGRAVAPGFSDNKARGTIWDDAEVTGFGGWMPLPGLYPIKASAGATGSARYDHVATPLAGNSGFLVTGGQNSSGPVADNWLVGALAQFLDGNSGPFTVTPVFVPASNLTTARAVHAAALMQDGNVVVAGGVAGSTVLASVELFAVSTGKSIPLDGSDVLGPSVAGSALPQAQAYASFVVLSGHTLLIAGGLGTLPDGFLNAVVSYDTAIRTFETFPGPILSMPFTLAPVGSIGLADGTILILGSTSPPPFPNSPASMTGFAWTFDPATNLSTITGAPVVARVGATLSVLSNGTVLVAGGMGMTDSGFGVLDTAEIYDPRGRTFRKLGNKMSAPRCGHTATALADGTVLLAGGYFFPPIDYDPSGVITAWVPTLDGAEIFNVAQQAFTAIATTLPKGFALHSATLLASGDVLIAGGVTDFYIECIFTPGVDLPSTQMEIFPSTQAAVFDVAAQSLAMIAPLGTARAMHSASLLGTGQVLVAGGAVTPGMTATASTELFDPGSYSFSPSAPMAVPRHSQGAILLPDGLLVLGGASPPSYEIIPPGSAQRAAHPLPFPLPSPDYPVFMSLTETVTPIPVAGRGIYAFGGQVNNEDGSSTCEAMLYVTAPPAPDTDARRQALVYTQSRQLHLAPPINDEPLEGTIVTLTGLIDDIEAGRTLFITGNPPLAQTIGNVTGIGGTPELPAGTIIMVLAPVQSTTGRGWLADVPDRSVGVLAIETNPAKPPSALYFLSGNGSTIGNVTAAQLDLFTRPLQSEAIVVQRVQQKADTNTTTLTLHQPLRYVYDRTTTSVYGNVVEVTQGSTVADEVLGSGDGQKPFLQFLVRQAPLTWLEQADGSIAPQLRIRVNGVPWQRVETLCDCGPYARAYQLAQDAQGRARIQFGDGAHGLRPPTGQNNITATYRVGAGTSGNVPAGSLTRPPIKVAGIKSVLNPVAATGGINPPLRSDLRRQIPIGVCDLGRIVTEDDMRTFLLNRPEVGAATLSTAPTAENAALTARTLITLAGLQNSVPDMTSSTFVSLTTAFRTALASGSALPCDLLPYEPLPFKVTGTFTANARADPQKVEDKITALLRAIYDITAMRFHEAVRATDICAEIRKSVPGIEAVTVTKLWAPTREPMLPTDSGEVSAAKPVQPMVLYPYNACPPKGAQILCLSMDSDAVTFTPGSAR